MRDDPIMAATLYKSTGCALLIASSVLLSIPVNAQTAHKASKSAKASVPVLPSPAPVLEPKAIEILKAACAKLAAAHSMSFTAGIRDANPSRLRPPLIHHRRHELSFPP